MTRENIRFIRKMQSGIRIRKVSKNNADSYKALMNASKEAMKDYYKQTTYKVYGIESEGDPAGIICITEGEEMLEVLWLLVAEEKRRNGLGSALLIKAKEYAIERGLGFVGALYPDNIKGEDISSLDSFFEENGFYMTDKLSEGERSAVCDLNGEIEDFLEEENDDVQRVAEEVPPMAALIIQKLQSLKEVLQENGRDAELVLSERAFLWAGNDTADVQVSIVARNMDQGEYELVFSSFVEVDDKDQDLSQVAADYNSLGFIATAVAQEGGIVLNYKLLESGSPVDERVFLATYTDFLEAVTGLMARL